MNALGHWSEPVDEPVECGYCSDEFDDEADLERHEIYNHFYCSPCDRHFKNANSISQHLRSGIHVGANLPCPFCQKGFAVATGVAHHLESGACPKAPLDRDQVFRAIARYDQNGQFTKKLINYHGAVTYEASDMAYNHHVDAWECYLCHKVFRTKTSLNQHLRSPTHQQALYHCPSLRCRKDFATVAALFNHLESEACGAMRFEEVQEQARVMMNPNRLLRYD
ncbi:hypothetical protein ACHAQH_004997 [Verticillium albo-atrum]